MGTLPKLIDETNIDSFLESIDNVITDCDGVLWSLDEVIEDADKVMNKLRSLGKKIFYATNNSTKTSDLLISKCEKLGYIALEGETISSAIIVAQYLKNLNFTKKVYIVGAEGLASELDREGIRHFGVGEDPVPENVFDLEKTVTLDPEVGAVVIGFDPYFNITKIMKAASYLMDPNCLFIATNRDEQFPIRNKSLTFPGTGTFVQAMETVTGRKAHSVGKPDPEMFTVLQKKYNLNPSRTVMIGDRCSTDILLGKNCSLQTLVVLSGVNSWNDLQAWSKSSDPEEWRLLADYYLPSLGDMLKLLPQ